MGELTVTPLRGGRFVAFADILGFKDLFRPIENDRDAEWALLPIRLGDVHPLDSLGLGGPITLAHPFGQSGLAGRRHDDQPVDARRRAASIALGHPPHAQESIGTGPKH